MVDAESVMTISADGKTSVEIWTIKIDHNVDKPLVDIPVSRSKNNMESENPNSLLLDIGRVKQIITVTGYLADDSITSALEKKNNLLEIIFEKREIIFSWGGSGGGNRMQYYTGNINKCMISETPGLIGEGKSGYYCEKQFMVTVSLILGSDA